MPRQFVIGPIRSLNWQSAISFCGKSYERSCRSTWLSEAWWSNRRNWSAVISLMLRKSSGHIHNLYSHTGAWRRVLNGRVKGIMRGSPRAIWHRWFSWWKGHHNSLMSNLKGEELRHWVQSKSGLTRSARSASLSTLCFVLWVFGVKVFLPSRPFVRIMTSIKSDALMSLRVWLSLLFHAMRKAYYLLFLL